MLSSYQHLRVEREGPAVILTLDRPAVLNAIDHVMFEELVRALRSVDDDPASSVVIITGAGRGFCAGGDMSAMPGAGADDYWKREDTRVHSHERHLIEALIWLEKPVIAMVNGPASGLGATLALFCDVVVASDQAFFNDSHVQVGLVAGDGASVIWPLLIGMSRAKEYLMTADRLPAAEAERLGLISHVVPAAELRATTLKLAEKLAASPPFAVRATKASVNRHLRRAVEDILDVSSAWQRISHKMPAHAEAVRAFEDRRRKR